MRLRLQTQLLIVMITILSVLTVVSLLVVRHSVQREVQRQTLGAVNSSVLSFDRLQKQQYSALLRTAAMMAELPTLKAAMATNHPATIQDASAEFWKLSEADLLVLGGTTGQPLAAHASESGFSFDAAKRVLRNLSNDEEESWWQDSTGLYRIAHRPIIAGSGNDRQALGVLVLGLRIDDSVAYAIGRLVDSDVVLGVGDSILATTLPQSERMGLMRRLNSLSSVNSLPRPIQIGDRHYESAFIDLQAGLRANVRSYILVSLESTNRFLARLNAIILVLALVVAALGIVLLRLVSSAITRPLDELISAVRALASGNSSYTLIHKGSVEVAELSSAFLSMREQLTESQRRQLEAERLAALGRAAGSISHDLRHHLAALVANAEFLHDSQEVGADRDDLYREVQRASEQMTMLIDSLVEVSRERSAVNLSEGMLNQIVSQSLETVRANPEYRTQPISVQYLTTTHGLFDAPKLQRAFFNILLNACEAVASTHGSVHLVISSNDQYFECRVSDEGPGVPEDIRGSLFEPFVSSGKHNGTGLGLTIASKIVRDHDGELILESTSCSGTTFLIRLPKIPVPTDAEAIRTPA